MINSVCAQNTNNYQYDEEGRLRADLAEGITRMDWNAYGQIVRITHTDTSHTADLEFEYNVQGYRVLKLVKPRNGNGLTPENTWTYIYYVVDANGNCMTTYKRNYDQDVHDNSRYVEHYVAQEHHIIGGKKLGYNKPGDQDIASREFTATHNVKNQFADVQELTSQSVSFSGGLLNISRGNSFYQLNNYADNILSVITDRKIIIPGKLTYGVDLVSSNDYDPGGMTIFSRSFSSHAYRYRFRGYEADDEISGTGNSYTTLYRQYDPRLMRWKSLDPKMDEYSSLSAYSAFANNPISVSDKDGDRLTIIGGREELIKFESIINDAFKAGNAKVSINRFSGAVRLTGSTEKLSKENKVMFDAFKKIIDHDKVTLVRLMERAEPSRKYILIGGSVPVRGVSNHFIDLYDVEKFIDTDTKPEGLILHEIWEGYSIQVKGMTAPYGPNPTHAPSAHEEALLIEAKISGITRLDDVTDENGNGYLNYIKNGIYGATKYDFDAGHNVKSAIKTLGHVIDPAHNGKIIIEQKPASP